MSKSGLEVIRAKVSRTASGNWLSWFRCHCGNGVLFEHRYGRRAARSCGCVTFYTTPKKHGNAHKSTHSGAYKSWTKMKSRCNNPANVRWDRYGGRGIKVCERWINSFENFLADMGDRPAGMSIDRINNEGDYEPANCRWSTNKEQCANRGMKCEYRGKKYLVRQLAEMCGIPTRILSSRLSNGWSVERAVEQAVRKSRPRGTKNVTA